MHERKALERGLEMLLFRSRWLMAPFYIGMVVALVMLLAAFVEELLHALPDLLHTDPEHVILTVLSLIDLSLAGNLVVIVIFSGYENFVSKIQTDNHEDRPNWMGTLDFSGLKIKLIASIVAISGIHLLKIFMNLPKYTTTELQWYVTLHLTFVGSGVAFALMDLIEEKAHKMSAKH